jgi:predicted HicB family RNase H-like nuclease
MTVLRHKGYIAEIDIDEEDGLFFGQVINVPGVITFYGRDVAELNTEFAKSVAAYEDLCKKHSIEEGGPQRRRLLVQIPPDQRARIAAAAARSGKSVNAWVLEALDRAATEALAKPTPRHALSDP